MKKSILLVLFLAISVSSFIGCNYKEAIINNEESNISSAYEEINDPMEEILQGSDMSGKLVNTYETIDEINNDSTLAVMGTIIHNEYIDYGGLIFTISEFKVDKVIKGDIESGNTIKFLQSGGGFQKLNITRQM